jgi:hypothetical protein
MLPDATEGSITQNSALWPRELGYIVPRTMLSALRHAIRLLALELALFIVGQVTPSLRAADTTEGVESNLKSQISNSTTTTQHWAFQLPKDYPVPKVNDSRWPKTPIDFFILVKLEEKGLRPAPPADKRTLLRRAAFDLTGLPPALEEADAFVADESPDAFARVVDRLLASPRHGERWGRYWLDVARYADTKGYVYGDREEPRFVHSNVYRDWVIRALNEDMPYDRFLSLQIAADLLFPLNFQPETRNPKLETQNPDLAATGFLTLGRRFLGVIHDIIDDRIDVLMRGTQALTVGCARCHDHKFDPIPTKDYYALYGVFASCTEKMLPLAEPNGANPAAVDFENGLKERVEKYDQTMQQKREEFSNRFRTNVTDYLVAVLDVKKLPTEEHYEIRGPNDLNPTVVRAWESYLAQTKREFHPVFAPWHALAELPLENFAENAAEKLATLGPVASNGLAHLIADRSLSPHPGPLPKGEGQGEGKGDANKPEGLVSTESFSSPRQLNGLVLQALNEKPVNSMRDVAERYGKLMLRVHQRWQETLQNAATNRTQPPTALGDPDWEQLRPVLYGPNAPVNIPILAAADLEWYFDEPTRVQLMKLHAEIERWIIRSPGARPYSVVLEDRPNPKNSRVFVRGNPANKGEEAPRQFLEVLSRGARRPFSNGSGRLELAQAIASQNNPLTARVMVNRVWLHHFGAGLVRTPSDFGTRSEPPSHPELLDWLARYFMQEGWSLKKLHRLILVSSVYQQSSEYSVTSGQYSVGPSAGTRSTDYSAGPSRALRRAATVDPENRLLWQMNRHRLDFEALRDSLFAVTGELETKAGGPPVDLFKPPFNPRRSVYGLIDRQFLPAVYRVFDFANPDLHNPQRPETTVPQQALFFMNSPFVMERARALLRRPELSQPQDSAARIRTLYQTVYQRAATTEDVQRATEFIHTAESLPPYQAPPPPVPVWFYGYGTFDETAGRVTGFTPLPHFTGDSWQGGAKWPDAKLGWVRLTAEGGHTGNDLAHAAIRRWVAPLNAMVSITGTLKHDHEAGDGVRARLVSSRHGVLGNWTVHKNKAETKLESVQVQKGGTLDFVVDYNANLNSDDFAWSPVIKVAGGAAEAVVAEYPGEWNAKKDFSGPAAVPPEPLTAWEQLAQVMLLANEFVFVD